MATSSAPGLIAYATMCRSEIRNLFKYDVNRDVEKKIQTYPKLLAPTNQLNNKVLSTMFYEPSQGTGMRALSPKSHSLVLEKWRRRLELHMEWGFA